MKKLVITVLPDLKITYYQTAEDPILISNMEAAKAMGVKKSSIRTVKRRNTDSLVFDKDWKIKRLDTIAGVQEATMWTREGIYKLSLLVNTEQANEFCTWLETFDPFDADGNRGARDIIIDMYSVMVKDTDMQDKTKQNMTDLINELRKHF